ncbi:17690_t:CDS:1, partial [Funneliformis geosporum]
QKDLAPCTRSILRQRMVAPYAKPLTSSYRKGVFRYLGVGLLTVTCGYYIVRNRSLAVTSFNNLEEIL